MINRFVIVRVLQTLSYVLEVFVPDLLNAAQCPLPLVNNLQIRLLIPASLLISQGVTSHVGRL